MKTVNLKVIVTGGGSGIGLAIARLLASSNIVAIVGRDLAKLQAAQRLEPRLRPSVLDVSDEGSATQGVASVSADLGGIDLLINAAGMVVGYPTAGPDTATLAERDMEINVLGSLRMVRLSLPHLQHSGQGAVVFISSVMAIAPAPGFGVYSASKAAVHSLAQSLRHELSPVRVFEVLPTWVDSGPTRNLHVPKLEPNSVAKKVVAGLASDRYEILVGRAGAVQLASRVSPRLAEALVARATRG